MSAELGAIRINEVLHTARQRAASDVHFISGELATLRIDGQLVRLQGATISGAALQTFLDTALTSEALERLTTRGTADGSGRTPQLGAYRIHGYRQNGSLRVAVRLLAQSIPQLPQLHLPAVIASFAHAPLGLVLFTGPTGCGKTTALAALIDSINRNSERNIITIEDPIEYLHAPVRSLIAHCEIGRDVVNYAEALRGVLRADPDVILIGEMRDRETIAAALTAAETGHLVFATLHTNDAAQTVDRMVDAFPSDAQNQIRAQLGAVLVAAVALRLVPRLAGPGRCAAAEVLVATDAVRNLIREGKTHQLRNAIVTGRKVGMQTLESDLTALVARRDISREAALAVATRPLEIDAMRGVA